MAGPSIRGHQGRLTLYQDGAVAGLVNITGFSVNQDSTFMRTNYAGVAIPEGDQAIEGWSGDADFEVKDSSLDDFIDALATNNLNGIGVSDYVFVLTEDYPDGTTKSYMYTDCQFKMGRKQEGLQSKVTKRLDFQASWRKPL